VSGGDGMKPRREASGQVGGRFEILALEPSLPATPESAIQLRRSRSSGRITRYTIGG
jgi:hypothetical protein